jgi:predicted lipoprotein with Yx(FWY)xxD motif
VGGAIVTIAKTPLGRIFLDSKGRALYDFPPDKGGMSTRYGACAARGSTLRDVRRQRAIVKCCGLTVEGG